MEKASFSIERYYFDKVLIDLQHHTSDKLFVDFKPSGIFNSRTQHINLNLTSLLLLVKRKTHNLL